jgi:hypothetical protein
MPKPNQTSPILGLPDMSACILDNKGVAVLLVNFARLVALAVLCYVSWPQITALVTSQPQTGVYVDHEACFRPQRGRNIPHLDATPLARVVANL